MKLHNLKQLAVFTLTIFSLTALASESGGQDRHNLTSNAFGNILGLTNLEYSYRFTDHLTVGITGYSGKGKLGDFELKDKSYGVIARYYIKPAFDESSWYVAAGIEKKNYVVTATSNGDEYKGELKETVGSVGVGYQWFWDSFNIGLGVLATNQPKVELIDISGNKYRDTLQTNMNLDFTIGGKF